MKKIGATLIILVIAGTMGFILVRNKAVIDQRSQVKETAKSVTVQPVAFQNRSGKLATTTIGAGAASAK